MRASSPAAIGAGPLREFALTKALCASATHGASTVAQCVSMCVVWHSASDFEESERAGQMACGSLVTLLISSGCSRWRVE